MLPTTVESRLAVVAVLLGLCVALALAESGAYFLGNVAFYWGSQLAVLAAALLLKPRPIVVAGTAFVLAIYLAAFGFWLFTRTHGESMAWLGYVASLPGAIVGAWGATVFLRNRLDWRPLIAGALSSVAVLLGVVANQAIVCTTVMYCGGK